MIKHQRLVTGLLVAGGWLLLLVKGPFWLFWLVFVGLGTLALNEYFAMTLARHSKYDRATGTLLGLFPLLSAYEGDPETVSAALFIALFFLIVYLLTRYPSLARADKGMNGFEILMRLGFGIFYVGFSFAHFSLLWTMNGGKYWLILLTVITVFSDSAAYYTGRYLGRHKLAPAISPGKTIEGMLGGLIGSIIAAIIVRLMFFPGFNMMTMVILTVFLSMVGVMGDLTESVIKRSMNVKDSGNILPGHGGVLDRLDSLMIATPVLFYMIHFGILGY
ncbi:MAG: phosphatidate cytidylyltransferase [Proteobacteria bacterium]|nr:phosphatidate cytidylyltransferase [Pseudomonadota bacterium]MBU1687756.1 phosphatidate cytidylyltransferase [Pseudomonadota bacterium]